ncbi:NAD(P)/FAD-dependent oxidoreductase [Vibrio sp. WJH972]
MANNSAAALSEDLGLWNMSAPSIPDYLPLTDDIETEVAIIGGGYTGLSTAINLAAKGVNCRVLEAQQIGFGGAGRNCGMVNPGIWIPPQDVSKHLGEESANVFLEEMAGGPDYVFSLIEKYNIDCEATRVGTIHAAHAPSGYRELAARAEEWQRRGREVELLDARAAEEKIGTSRYFGGLLDRNAGTVNPMGYARGLALAAASEGAQIHEKSRVTKLTPKGEKWVLNTESGSVTADRVLIATNGYSDDLWPNLNKSWSDIYFHQIATEPLGSLADNILPEGQGVWDTGLVMCSVRKDKFGRLILGSMGKLADKAFISTEFWAQRQISKMFPHLGKVRFEKSWHGIIALTPEHIPRIHNLSPGLYSALGFNGRGITTGSIFGRAMANLLTGMPEKELLLPITNMKADIIAPVREPVYETCFKVWRHYKSV